MRLEPRGKARKAILKRLREGPATPTEIHRVGKLGTVRYNLREMIAEGLVEKVRTPASRLYRLLKGPPEDEQAYVHALLDILESGAAKKGGRWDGDVLVAELEDYIVHRHVGGTREFLRIAELWPATTGRTWPRLCKILQSLVVRVIAEGEEDRRVALRAVSEHAETVAMSANVLVKRREACFELLRGLQSPKLEGLASKLLQDSRSPYDEMWYPREILKVAARQHPGEMRARMLRLIESRRGRVGNRAREILESTRSGVSFVKPERPGPSRPG